MQSCSTKLIIVATMVFFFIPIVVIMAGIGGVAAILSSDNTNATLGDTSFGCGDVGMAGGGTTGYQIDQLNNAATIVTVGKQMNVPQQGWVVAVAAAMQESGLHNLDYGDRDSLGLFQQRPSQGWGSPAQVMDPTYASIQFYRHLLAVSGWQHMTVNDAAQVVQRSGFPNAYAQREQAAREIVTAVQRAICTPTSGQGASPPPASTAAMSSENSG